MTAPGSDNWTRCFGAKPLTCQAATRLSLMATSPPSQPEGITTLRYGFQGCPQLVLSRCPRRAHCTSAMSNCVERRMSAPAPSVRSHKPIAEPTGSRGQRTPIDDAWLAQLRHKRPAFGQRCIPDSAPPLPVGYSRCPIGIATAVSGRIVRHRWSWCSTSL